MKAPIYEQLRPTSFEEIVGQTHLVGERGILTSLIKKNRPLSFLLWGPPGCGKTTIARLYAKAFTLPFFTISGAEGQIAEAKKIIKEIEASPLIYSHAILFVDEIHRINKAGQDLFLPHVEKGTITLIAATTENPSFVVNNALLSRMQVFEVKPLEEDELRKVIGRFLQKNPSLEITEEAQSLLLAHAGGDARYLLTSLESVSLYFSGVITKDEVEKATQKRRALYDKTGEGHYNLISTLHKAVRSSDPDAALYWFARMVHGGEDIRFLARRIIRMATEDIGLADPEALTLAVNASATYDRLGSPEGELALAEALVYLALAPKSNAVYVAYKKAMKYAEKFAHENPPRHALNAPTKLMKTLSYGKGYEYDHDTEYGCSGLSYFPESFEESPRFYTPKQRGSERELQKRLDFYQKIRSAKKREEKANESQNASEKMTVK